MARKERAAASEMDPSQVAAESTADSKDAVEDVGAAVSFLPTGKYPDAEAALGESTFSYDSGITQEQRVLMIAEAAYYIAQRRGFDLGSPLEDWLIAEAQIDALLGER